MQRKEKEAGSGRASTTPTLCQSPLQAPPVPIGGAPPSHNPNRLSEGDLRSRQGVENRPVRSPTSRFHHVVRHPRCGITTCLSLPLPLGEGRGEGVLLWRREGALLLALPLGEGWGEGALSMSLFGPLYARCSVKHRDTCMLPRTFVVPPSSDQQPSCPTSRKPSAARSTGALHQVFATCAAGRNFSFFRAQIVQMVWRRTTCEYNSVRANVDETHPLFCRRAIELVGATANPCLATASNCDGRSKKPRATSSSA
jgi:hypothetical protein